MLNYMVSTIVVDFKAQYTFPCIHAILYPLSHQRFRIIKGKTFWQQAQILLDQK